MAKARDIRKIQLYIIITIAALIGGAFAAVRITQRKRAKKVDGILDACMEDPNCVVDKGGNVENGNGNGNGENGIITNAVAESKARALVDDIWGFTFTIKKGIWNQLMAYDDDNFAKIVRKANSYIQNKEWGLTYGAPWDSKPTNFYDLVEDEKSPRLNSGNITNRITRLGLN